MINSMIIPRTREQCTFSILVVAVAVACAWGGVILPAVFLTGYAAWILSEVELKRTDAGSLEVWRRVGILRLKVSNIRGNVTVSVSDRSYSRREASYHVLISADGISLVIHRSSNAGDAYSMAKGVEAFCRANSQLGL